MPRRPVRTHHLGPETLTRRHITVYEGPPITTYVAGWPIRDEPGPPQCPPAPQCTGRAEWVEPRRPWWEDIWRRLDAGIGYVGRGWMGLCLLATFALGVALGRVWERRTARLARETRSFRSSSLSNSDDESVSFISNMVFESDEEWDVSYTSDMAEEDDMELDEEWEDNYYEEVPNTDARLLVFLGLLLAAIHTCIEGMLGRYDKYGQYLTTPMIIDEIMMRIALMITIYVPAVIVIGFIYRKLTVLRWRSRQDSISLPGHEEYEGSEESDSDETMEGVTQLIFIEPRTNTAPAQIAPTLNESNSQASITETSSSNIIASSSQLNLHPFRPTRKNNYRDAGTNTVEEKQGEAVARQIHSELHSTLPPQEDIIQHSLHPQRRTRASVASGSASGHIIATGTNPSQKAPVRSREVKRERE